ncbi:MAG: exopolyphosphatase / guanosine-5'-triphosphate,3'-diphosphate pyrophosphatase [Bacteroidetes bacterium HLUCCA01]|nr:MAG: exopolyphosphatase / guanosine-5'-triphosphate,3'-diphosphate pyrophosphatase [Bacteroidetes bacterium HLUCCA01]
MIHPQSASTPSSTNQKRRIAAIDIGTNSFHAVIVDIRPDGTYDTIDALKEMVTLGRDGLGKNLSEEAMLRGLEALQKIKTLCDSYRVEQILAYATSAIREAANGGEFIQRAIDEVQIKIRAIPGTTEAELIGFAVQHALSLNGEMALIMDIGGGSTEFIIADHIRLYFLDSRKTGVARMSADYVKEDPISKASVKKLEAVYTGELVKVDAAVKERGVTMLVGSSGTMQNIAAMIAAERLVAGSNGTAGTGVAVMLNEFEYTRQEFTAFYRKFLKMDHKQRLVVPGLDAKRVDFIVAGLVQVHTVLTRYKIDRIKTSTEAMREGIILRYIKREMQDLRLLEVYPDTRTRSVYELLRKCSWHEDHSTQVTRLALRIFEDTRSVHGLGDHDRQLLEFASLMHDIGYHISHKKHHKHALYLIQNADLKGFTQEEIEIMAHVARYHRRSVPKAGHALFQALTREQKSTVRSLAGILRVADGLDRSHYQNVQDIRTVVRKSVVEIQIRTQGDPELEIWGAMRKRELFEKLMHRKLQIVRMPG